MILLNGAQCLYLYNLRTRPDYNRAARKVYFAGEKSFLRPEHVEVIILALRSFGMARQMGAKPLFTADLAAKLRALKWDLNYLHGSSLDTSFMDVRREVRQLYQILNLIWPSHVGTTKLLHFLLPNLCIIIDSNVRTAFRECYGIGTVGYRRGSRPGYSVERYLKCMEIAHREVRYFGADRLRCLETDSPLARIFDKIAFAKGKGWG